MSGNQNVPKIIDYVKEKIELCIQKYMNLKETITYLDENHHICHHITTAIWEHLQKENPNFFKEYKIRCEVARQIASFNDLLAQQVDLIQRFREIDLRTTAPVTKLQKPNDDDDHQDQIYDFALEESISYLTDHTAAPVTKLPKLNDDNDHHYQYQIHDQWIGSNGIANREESVSCFINSSPFAATPQSNSFTSEIYDPEQVARDLEQLQQRLELKVQRQQQPQHLMDQQEVYFHQQHESTTPILQGDGPTSNNGSAPTYDL